MSENNPTLASMAPRAPGASAIHMDTSKLKGVALSNADRIPSNWDIQPVGDSEDITAINNITNKTFSGSRKEFRDTYLKPVTEQ
jgi:hypothetical protein